MGSRRLNAGRGRRASAPALAGRTYLAPMGESETSASPEGRLRLCDFIRDNRARVLEE